MEAPFHYRAFVARLQNMGLRGLKSGRGMLFQCPAHADRNPSMKVDWSDTAPEHAVLVHCKAGCTTADICRSMGDPTQASLYPMREQAKVFVGSAPPPQPTASEPEPESEPQVGRTPVARYDYTDEQGTVLSYVIRYTPKGFSQCRADGVPKLDGVRRVLYKLHLWHKKHPSIFLTEGEKDADTLLKLGLPATTNMGGAGNWRPEYTQQLVDGGVKRIAICPDNDEAGEKHALFVAEHATSAGIEVRIVRLEGLSKKGDVTDWIASGKEKADVVAAARAAAVWTQPAAVEKQVFNPRGPMDLDSKKVEFLVEGVLPDGMFGEIAGRDGRGKSLLGMEIAKCVLTGEPLFGEFPVKKKGPVLLVMLDDPEWLVRARLEELGLMKYHNNGLHVATLANVDMSDRMLLLKQIADWCVKVKPAFVLIDALYIFTPESKGSNDQMNSQGAMLPIVQGFDNIANASEATVALVAHENKAGTDVQGSQSIRNMAKWILRITLPPKYETDVSGGKVTPHRVLQAEKSKIMAAAQWGLRLDGAGKWTRCEIEEAKTKSERKAELRQRIIEWLQFFLEKGPRPREEVREASIFDGNKFPWRVVNDASLAEEAGVEKYHPSAESPWFWRLRQESGSAIRGSGEEASGVDKVRPEREGDSPQATLLGLTGASVGENEGAGSASS